MATMTIGGLKKMLVISIAMFLTIPSFTRGAEPKPILIGATVSLEGKYSEPSFMIRNAFRLWEQEVNIRGGLLGRPVKLILYDDKSQKKLVRQLYKKLIMEEKVDLVFSPYGTPLTLVASEVSERNKMVMLACAASGEQIWERQYKYVFGVYALAKRYFIGLLDLMAREGFENVAILYEDSPFHIDVAAGTAFWAKRFGIEVTLKKPFNHAKSEFPELLEKAIDVNVDGLIFSAYPPECYQFLDLMKKTKYRPKVLGITIAPTHPDFYKKTGIIAEGVFGPSQWEPDERIPFPGTKKFIEGFVAYAKKVPSYHAGSAYAASQILEKAIIQTKSLNHNKIREYIRAMDTVTVIGRFKVDHKGKQIGHNPIMIQWQKGEKEIVYPTKMQTASARF
jgi:branched-chain amino acid transport system substrate-binding protein